MWVISGGWEDNTGKELKKYYTAQTGINFNCPFSALGFVDNKTDTLKVVTLFIDYNEANIEMLIFGTLTRQVLKTVAEYVFNGLKCQRLTVKVAKNKKELNKIVLRAGFIYECTLKHYYTLQYGRDAVMYYATRQHAERWMK